MKEEQIAFLELVKSGLWGNEPDKSAFSSKTDWKRLYKIGKKQALLGVMFDGMQRLPDELKPERGIYIQWCTAVLLIEDNNRKLNHELGNLYSMLRSEGIEPVLMKGQGVAQYYPEPLHRVCGDIDIFIGKKDYEATSRLLSKDGHESAEMTSIHSTFDWHGVVVENHNTIDQMASPKSDRELQKIVESWHHGRERKMMIEGTEVLLPPLDFDVVFIFHHALYHLLSSGVGFRQLCDWARMLHVNRDNIDKEEVRQMLKALRIEGAARIFEALEVEYLGMPSEDLILEYGEDDKRKAKILFDDIWNSGNFGFWDDNRSKRPEGYWKGKMYTFKNEVKRSRKVGQICPREARWIAYRLFRSFAKVQMQRLIK